MNIRTLNLLLVDDHKMTLVGYTTALTSLNEMGGKYKFNTTDATSIEEALKKLDDRFNYRPFDLVFLDIKLPKDPTTFKYQSGEDLGVLIRERFPETKIMIITTFDNNLLIQNLLERINPEGLIIKSDLTPDNFMHAVLDVMEDPPFYSKTVTKFLRKQHQTIFHLDRLDRLILYYISIGKLTKDLPIYIPLSLPTIEKRKKRLKEIFDVEDGNDIDLIRRSEEEGFI